MYFVSVIPDSGGDFCYFNAIIVIYRIEGELEQKWILLMFVFMPSNLFSTFIIQAGLLSF